MNAQELKKELASNAISVCQHLFPNGINKGNEWLVGSLDGESGRTLQICIKGSKAGVWADFNAGCKGNNLLELWIQKTGDTFLKSFEDAKSFLGIKEDSGIAPPIAKKEYSKPKEPSGTLSDKALQYFEGRKVSRDIVNIYKISSMPNDDIVFPYYSEKGELEMVKYIGIDRENGKKKVRASANSKKTLFGKHTINDNDSFIIITEGEVDAMSYAICGYPSLSVPFGAKWESETGTDPNSEWISNDWDFLERFEKIYISMDMDEAGQKALKSISKRLGIERCLAVKLPKNDANEVLVEKGMPALHEAFNAASYIDNEKLKNVSEFKDRMHEKFFGNEEVTLGIPLPWNIPFHWRMNELTVLTGFNGSGKSMFLNWLCVNLCQMGKSTCIASLEIRPDETLRALVRQSVGADCPKDETHLDESLKWLSDGFWFFDHHGGVKVEEMLQAFIYAHRRHNVQFFIIDSLMKCGLRFDDYNAQKKTMDLLTQFVDKYDVHVFLVAHSKKKDNEQERAGKMDVKGISEITDNAHNVLSIWRNKHKEETINTLRQSQNPQDRIKEVEVSKSVHDAVFSVEKQRGAKGEEPKLKLFYNINTRQYHTEHGQKETFVESIITTTHPPKIETYQEIEEDIY
jgi:twinkle protein